MPAHAKYEHVHFHLRYKKTHSFPFKEGSVDHLVGMQFFRWFWWENNRFFKKNPRSLKILKTNLIKEEVNFADFYVCLRVSMFPSHLLLLMHRRIYAFWLPKIFIAELISIPLWFYILSTHNFCSPDFGDAVISGLFTQPGTVITEWHIHSVDCLPSRMLNNLLAY